MSRPWMPLYVADYLGDTRRLNTLQHGAYLLLIMEYWQHGGLPDDDAELADIAGLNLEDWMAMRPKIARLFQDGWRHKRIDAELAKAAAISDRRSDNAKRRWGKSNANAQQEHCIGNANAQQEECTRARSTTTITDSEIDNSISETRGRQDDDLGREFDDVFWPEWGRLTSNKVAKKPARKAFDAARRKFSLDRILDGVRHYAATKPPTREWLHPATFLNQERFDDAPAPAPAARAGPQQKHRTWTAALAASALNTELGDLHDPRRDDARQERSHSQNVLALPVSSRERAGGNGHDDLCLSGDDEGFSFGNFLRRM